MMQNQEIFCQHVSPLPELTALYQFSHHLSPPSKHNMKSSFPHCGSLTLSLDPTLAQVQLFLGHPWLSLSWLYSGSGMACISDLLCSALLSSAQLCSTVASNSNSNDNSDNESNDTKINNKQWQMRQRQQEFPAMTAGALTMMTEKAMSVSYS